MYPQRTLTTYSFSKWLGLAGLRVGAMVAHPDVIETLANAPPNNLGSNVLSQRAALAGLRVKAEWFPGVQATQRANQTMIHDAVNEVDGLTMPVYPSNGNFVIIDVSESGIRPEALVEAYQRRNIMIRQGGYHTERFARYFVKVSTTVPPAWMEEFCDQLKGAVEDARGINDVGAQF